MNLKFEKTLISKLQVEEIIKRLNFVTEKFYTNSNQFKFEGQIYLAEFHIFPTFDYGPKNQLRPEVKGKVYESEKESLVKLSFLIPQSIKLLLILVFILNSAFVSFLYFRPLDKFIPWYYFTAFVVITYIIFYCVFIYKIKATIKIIANLVEAKSIKNSY